MKRLVAFAAIVEFLTGLALLAIPAVVVQLIFDAHVVDVGVVVARVAGIALLSLATACWLSRDIRPAVTALLVYNLLVTIYFAWIGLRGETVGVLLWPVAAFHGALVVPLSIALKGLRETAIQR